VVNGHRFNQDAHTWPPRSFHKAKAEGIWYSAWIKARHSTLFLMLLAFVANVDCFGMTVALHSLVNVE
jgi:hypothetical protein